MKVLFGMTSRRTPAPIVLPRQAARPDTGRRDAMAAGIAMIHQHFMLVDAMTVVENVMLGWPAAGRILRAERNGARACAKRAGALASTSTRTRSSPTCRSGAASASRS